MSKLDGLTFDAEISLSWFHSETWFLISSIGVIDFCVARLTIQSKLELVIRKFCPENVPPTYSSD